MNIKFVLINLGEPYSTFSEIIGKYLKKNKQLNQFSILFYKKLKQNSKINAY